MILVKIHKGEHDVAAICDKDLLGKTLSEGEIEVNVSEHFYGGEEKSEAEVKEIMKECDNLNILGKESVELTIKLGVIEKENVIYVEGVPHAQRISC